MKTKLDIHHEGTLGSDGRISMTFDENSIAHLMGLLTDLYSNKPLAVLREYSTNALDAHVAAGNPAPIEVTLPNHLAPTLVIKDYGTGMNIDTITHVLSKYGASTKRDTDEEVGMLGVGFKSGLTYTSQFTVVSVHDGVKAVVLVTRLENGGAALQIVDTSGTDEPNGTEVRIPVKHVNEMRDEARDFFRFWEPGTVLLDGDKPYSIFEDTGIASLKLDPDVLLVETDVLPSDFIIMGNVPYPVSEEHAIIQIITRHGYRQRAEYRVVVRVPIGSVGFTPSREALQYTKRTLDTIATARDFVTNARNRIAQDAVDAAPSHLEAYRAYRRVKSMSTETLTYRGSAIPHSIRFTGEGHVFEMVGATGKASIVKYASITMERAAETMLFVTGYGGKGIHENMKTRINLWLDAHPEIEQTYKNYPDDDTTHYNPSYSKSVFVVKDDVFDPWLDHIRRVPIEEIRAIELDAPQKQVRKPRAKFRLLDSGGGVDEHKELRETTKLACWMKSEQTGVRSSIAAFVAAATEGGKVLIGTKADENRIARDHPDLPEFVDFYAATMTRLAAEMSDIDRATTCNKHDTVEMLRRLTQLGDEKVLDPELLNLVRIKMASAKGGLAHAWSLGTGLHWHIYHDRKDGKTFELPTIEAPGDFIERVKAVSKRYPILFGCNLYANEKQVADYVNAIYLIQEQVNLLPITY